MIARNPDLNPPAMAGVVHYWTAPTRALYMPVTYTAWAGTALIASDSRRSGGAGLSPAWFHALSVCIHIGCAMLLFALLHELIGNANAAMVGALFFALHPLQVESIAW